MNLTLLIYKGYISRLVAEFLYWILVEQVIKRRWGYNGDDEEPEVDSENLDVLEIMVVVSGACRCQSWPAIHVLHVKN